MHCRTIMKYFLILLVSITSLLSVSGKIPDYIHICNAKVMDINGCVLDSINYMRDKIADGIPEFSVPPLDPCFLEKLILDLGPGLEAEFQDLFLTGAKDFKIIDLIVNVTANTYTFAVTIPEIIGNGNYDINASIASIPLKGKGPIHFSARSISGKGTLYGKKVIRDGKTYNWYPNMTMKLDVAEYDLELKNLFEKDPAIGKVTNELLNSEKTAVLTTLLPGIEKAVIERLLLAANNICKHFSWDVLFPES